MATAFMSAGDTAKMHFFMRLSSFKRMLRASALLTSLSFMASSTAYTNNTLTLLLKTYHQNYKPHLWCHVYVKIGWIKDEGLVY